ncbi:MAG: type II toxin-antitoxin system VapC family toxin [Candidatus Verstraetearchaeota archaeon]|nr:type II toxin-antitoxin system VapC family toxin [Candidatus Verstraetearchaeota archaeon]
MPATLQIERAYIDTNIFDYVALKHPVYGKACKRITDDIRDRKIEAHCSYLVPIEILGSLTKVDPEIAAGAVLALLSFPINMIPIDEAVLRRASSIMVEFGTTYDAVHAAAMEAEGLATIITEDVGHWGRPKHLKVIRPQKYLELVGGR